MSELAQVLAAINDHRADTAAVRSEIQEFKLSQTEVNTRLAGLTEACAKDRSVIHKRIDGVNKKIWGTAAAAIVLLLGFFIWYIQTKG